MEEPPYHSRRIADLSEDDRPRERLQMHGARALSNSELIAILLGSGTARCSAIDLAQQLLLRADNNLAQLGRFTIEDFKREKGIGDAKAITLIAALELGRRRKESDAKTSNRLQTPTDIAELMLDDLCDLPHEEMWVIYLNRQLRLLSKRCHSKGTSAFSLLDNKIVVREALELRADAIALCHNHPTGDTKPSQLDIDITGRLLDALQLFDIRLLDHIVIGGRSFCSMRERGLLDSSKE